MEFIRKIEIRHFRSIYELEIDQLSHVNIFSGMNDVGKSNILKALHLFFWNETDWDTPLWVHRDANAIHEHIAESTDQDCIIRVKVYFAAPGRHYEDLLPDGFWIQRCWNSIAPSREPDTMFGVPRQDKPNVHQNNAIEQILDSCRLFYIPAVRGPEFVDFLLEQVTHNFSHAADELKQLLTEHLEMSIDERVPEFSGLLQDSTGNNFDLRTAFHVNIEFEGAELFTDDDIPLHLRGDGMKTMVVPAILEYFTKRFRKEGFVLWAIEEPENSLEYRRASTLADQLLQEYSVHSQIFLTTHSPAFLDMQDERASVYRVFQKAEETNQSSGHVEKATDVEPVSIRGSEVGANLLPEELGFLEIVRRFNSDIRQLLENREAEISRLTHEVSKLKEPTLIVEGKHDVETLKHAWLRLYAPPVPFDIIEVNGENGVGDLVTSLIHRPNSRRNAALLDHDHAGINRFNKLSRLCNSGDIRPTNNICTCGDVMIMTLPPPTIPDRTAQAMNKNLSMEFYFSDVFLCEIDKRTGGQLFRADKWICYGKHIDLDEDSLKLLFDSGKKSMIHRALNNDESAKKKLVDALIELDDEDFLPFLGLFEIIVDHLRPGYALSRKPSMTVDCSA